jgi:RimJ/RimL family protein N-acetyltransferase
MTQLRTPRLLLRPVRSADVDALAGVYADPDVVQFLRPMDREGVARQVERFVAEWEERGAGILAIEDAQTHELLGRSGVHYWPEFDEVEIGWVVRRDRWGEGIATEAGAASVGWAFGPLGLSFVTAVIARENAGSIAVACKLGMTLLREDHVFERDVFVYVLRSSAGGGRA